MDKISPSSFQLLDTPVLIESLETKRYLFADGPPIKGDRGAEGGWLASSGFESPKVVGADANYYNRAYWVIRQSGEYVLIENQATQRYLFADGPPIKGDRGAEGGWLASSGFESPKVVGADANYYNRAFWTIYQVSENFIFENQATQRYLFADGAPIKGDRGAEGGWLASSGFESPNVVGADANYYNRAYWKIIGTKTDAVPAAVEYLLQANNAKFVASYPGGSSYPAGTYLTDRTAAEKWVLVKPNASDTTPIQFGDTVYVFNPKKSLYLSCEREGDYAPVRPVAAPAGSKEEWTLTPAGGATSVGSGAQLTLRSSWGSYLSAAATYPWARTQQTAQEIWTLTNP